MKATAQFTVGRQSIRFEIEERSEMETLHKLAVLSNPTTYCQCCQNATPELFLLDSNKDKEGNIYVNVVCKKCWAKAKLGQYKAGGFFWHKFEKYVKKETSEE